MSLTPKSLLETVEGFLEREKASLPIIVGYSGGQDSALLLFCLSKLFKDNRENVIAAYFNHNIRPADEVQREKKIVSTYAKDLGVFFHTESLSPGAIEEEARRKGKGIEDAARRQRHAFFQRAVLKFSALNIALGHTADDQFETMIMRFFTGSGPTGLKGIFPANGKIIRPLISLTRQEVRSLVDELEIPVVDDSTNENLAYLRNRVRRTLLPLAREIFPGVDTSLENGREKMILLHNYMEMESRKALDQIRIQRGRYDGRKLFELDPAIRLEIIFRICEEVRLKTDERIPYRFIRPLLFPSPPPKISGYGLELSLFHGVFSVKRVVKKEENGYSFILKLNATVEYNDIAYLLCSTPAKGFSCYRINVAETSLPLCLRSRLAGDNLKKWFQKEEVLLEDRNRIPLLESPNGVIGAFGSLFGYGDLLRKGLKQAGKILVTNDAFVYFCYKRL